MAISNIRYFFSYIFIFDNLKNAFAELYISNVVLWLSFVINELLTLFPGPYKVAHPVPKHP